MKKIFSILLSAVLCTALLAACGTTTQNTDTGQSQPASSEAPSADASGSSAEIMIYAAASLTESMDQIIASYQAEHPDVVITPNYGSSGTLVEQIIEGAPCDIFVSAAKKQMDQIDVTASAEVNPDGNDYVVPDSRFDLLENKCVLAVTEGNPAGLSSFEDLSGAFETDGFIFAMGGESVPVGAYTQKIFEYLKLDEKALANAGKITYGEDVKGVTSAIDEGAAQAGVIYASDAYSAGLQTAATATEEMTGGKVIYPAALIKNGTATDAAADFLAYLTSDAASAAFESVGFTTLN